MTPSQEYVLVESIYYIRNNPITCYGIALSEKEEDQNIIIQTINNISEDKRQTQQLVDQCNKIKPTKEELEYIIEDFLD